MQASDWSFRYSPGMPANPAATDGGWQFSFPNRNGVEYLTTSAPPASASQSIIATIEIQTVGAPFFEYRTEAENTCETPATVRLFFQRHGDNMSGDGPYEFYRWWSNNPVAYQLSAGQVSLVGDLTDPTQWTSVLGQRGDANAPMFRAALADLGQVGFTFGGGCFFGHGVYVTPGSGQAVFKATQFMVQ